MHPAKTEGGSRKRLIHLAQNLRDPLGLYGLETSVESSGYHASDFIQELTGTRSILFRQVAHIFAPSRNVARLPQILHPDIFERDFAAGLRNFPSRRFLQPLK